MEAAPLSVKAWVALYTNLDGTGLTDGDMIWVQEDDMFYPWDSTLGFPDQWEGVSVSGFKTKTKIKSSDTTRTSVTTDAIDPHLQVDVPAGLYHVEVHTYLDVASGTTANFHVQVKSDGVLGTGYSLGGMRRRYASSTTTGTDNETTASAANNGGSTGISTATSMPGSYAVDCVVEMLAPGKIGFYWSQASSSATGSTVKKGSFLRVTKM